MSKKIIRIAKGNLLHLTQEFYLDIGSILGDGIKFNSPDIFWEVKGKYDRGKLVLQVVDYYPKEISAYFNQKIKNKIDSIEFENLDWDELQRFLWTYTGSFRQRIVSEYTGAKKAIQTAPPPQWHKQAKLSTSGSNVAITREHEPVERIIHEHMDVLYKDSIFENGYVSFTKHFKWHYQPITIRVENPTIKSEFDAIKFYFAKAINGYKRFTVDVVIKLLDHAVISSEASSKEISSINEDLITGIKKKELNRLFNVKSQKEKSLADIDELFDAVDNNVKNVFKQTADDLINEVINREGNRNAKQLQFLSGAMQSKQHKMLFSMKPLFGFLFTIEGNSKIHYCWELLNSHATYIWTFDAGTSTARIEQTIALIQEVGREQYKHLYKAKEIDQDAQFISLNHHVNARDKDGFIIWKSQLNEIIKNSEALSHLENIIKE